jgi:hypothetical protein
MSRQSELEGRDAGWRDLAWAGAAAAAVTTVLAVSVALVWLLARTPAGAPPLGAQTPQTPTPRALSFIRDTPLPPTADTATADAPAADNGAAEAPAEAAAPTGTPELLAMTTGGAEPIEPDTDTVVFAAPGDAVFSDLAAGSWSATADALVNAGSSAVAEPWLHLTAVPDASFAIEAEMRVTRLLDTVCDQSFGLTGGIAETGQLFGGGLLFPCGAEAPRARLTNAAVWRDGYNADPLFAEEPFDPEDGWHTYRFELRGEQLRLLIDGVGVVSGAPDAAIDPTAAGAVAGLWAQGVGLEVRRVGVYPLPAT